MLFKAKIKAVYLMTVTVVVVYCFISHGKRPLEI